LVQGSCADLAITAGEDFKTGYMAVIGTDGLAWIYDPAVDAQHMAAFIANQPIAGEIALLRFVGVSYAFCKGGVAVQDRLMPSGGGDKGRVEVWSAGNVTAGFALEDAADGEIFPIVIHYELV
jgi:hypothetical protein